MWPSCADNFWSVLCRAARIKNQKRSTAVPKPNHSGTSPGSTAREGERIWWRRNGAHLVDNRFGSNSSSLRYITMDQQNPYTVLEVQQDASNDDIRRAYRKKGLFLMSRTNKRYN